MKKKLLFTLLLVAATMQSIAQDTFHAVSLTYGTWITSIEKYRWEEIIAVDIPVTIKGNVISIYSQELQVFRTLDDGVDLDAYTVQWYAIDIEGRNCNVRLTILDDNIFLSVSYSDVCYYYRIESY